MLSALFKHIGYDHCFVFHLTVFRSEFFWRSYYLIRSTSLFVVEIFKCVVIKGSMGRFAVFSCRFSLEIRFEATILVYNAFEDVK